MAEPAEARGSGIGTLGEGPLHAALKAHYRRPGDRVEVPVDGFVIDIVRPGSGAVADAFIEIQTGSFSHMRRKLDHLLDTHHIRVVHPIPVAKWIIRVDGRGRTLSRRKSPKHGIPADVCPELVSFPTLLSHPNFTLELALVHADEVRRTTRRGDRTLEHRLVEVVGSETLRKPSDLLGLLPGGLREPFTSADLARALGRDRTTAQAVAYCLREAGAVTVDRRSRAGFAYRLP